jgi:flagellar basal-body rod modification protein FlgD
MIDTSLTNAALGAQRNGASVGPGGRLGKNEFLKLLTTQLKYQDPLDPMDGKDMAADLAQFSGLEQLLNINEQLEAQQGQYHSLLTAMHNNVALGVIGKSVLALGDAVTLQKDAQGVIGGTVTADITTSGVAKLTLLDRSGKEVGSRSLGYVGTGRQEFDVGSAASKIATEGTYSYRITVTDANGKDVPQQTYTVGKIDGITYGLDGTPRLMMGNTVIDLSTIVRILA